ncbi:hypothetical protein BU204_24820 [Actinophytocola xanthii]|uniref:non-specific serine/threonine protein kinase n=2 Tax=Actinophytocola xanthii TaxID=1912961 RepID=A0A1Q8CKG8_9PSEU|nr:hypothetical protein BU204_24820 [Actinophytocola xanthii]
MLGDRYRLGAVLGRGGSATVYAATDVLLGREVAVKVCHPAGDPTHPHRFAAEARLLASLSHPGLVPVHDVCLEGDQPYLVMRLVRGRTLRDLLDDGPLEPAVVARHGARLAGALAHVHAHHIAHRDLKPANVLVDESGDCYLADFGIARAVGAPHLTVSGELVGTAAYLAPEQVTDTETGPPADVYSLGLVLLECLTGRPEFTGTTVEAAFARLTREPRIPDHVPPAWRSALRAMTATEPGRRPGAARCAELLAAIAAGAESRPSRPERARLRPAHAGLLALVATIASLVAAGSPAVPSRPVAEPPPVGGAPSGRERAADRAPTAGEQAPGTGTTGPVPPGTGSIPPPIPPPPAGSGGGSGEPAKPAEPSRGPGTTNQAGNGKAKTKAKTKTATKNKAKTKGNGKTKARGG